MADKWMASFLGFGFCLILGTPHGMEAQSIRLKFPRFEGKTWDWILMRGETQDTVQSGVIPSDGLVVLQVPDNRYGYQGMSRWLLRDGGGLDMVVNGEDFQVTCLSDQPNETNIIYSGSPENDFLRQNHKEQEQLMDQYAAVQMLAMAYPPSHPLHRTAQEEQRRLEKDWKNFRKKLAASPLYAARFREIVDMTKGIGGNLNDAETERGQVVAEFLSSSFSWQALYTSNHWSQVIYNWAQLHRDLIKNDDKFLSSARQILDRLPEAEIYTSFCSYMAQYLVKLGKESLLEVLSPEIRASNRLLSQEGFLAQFRAPQTGAMAPDLLLPPVMEEGAVQTSQVKEQAIGSLSASYSLLIFYLSDCGHCEETLKQLVEFHPILAGKDIRILSISADTDVNVFKETASSYPWKDKYFDGKGFNGPNFLRYGVAGTPTIFLLDKQGRIQVRTANLLEVLEWLENKVFR